jgi:DNA excision repair protein ERCC-6
MAIHFLLTGTFCLVHFARHAACFASFKKQGHRVIIFCQWRKMLNIIQRFVMMKGWKFGRLDGNTSVAARQRLVDNFNSDDSYFVMLATTRTGGGRSLISYQIFLSFLPFLLTDSLFSVITILTVGLNMTGANRVILYDPDW